MKEQIINWLDTIAKNDGEPPKEVIAFNFGLYRDESGYNMYLVGGFEYSEDDDGWASLQIPTAAYRYLKLPEQMQSQDWEFVLEQCVSVLKQLEKERKLNTTLFSHAIAITTGFDEGDLIKIR